MPESQQFYGRWSSNTEVQFVQYEEDSQEQQETPTPNTSLESGGIPLNEYEKNENERSEYDKNEENEYEVNQYEENEYEENLRVSLTYREESHFRLVIPRANPPVDVFSPVIPILPGEHWIFYCCFFPLRLFLINREFY